MLGEFLSIFVHSLVDLFTFLTPQTIIGHLACGGLVCKD